jgi:hypothetical protein
MSQQDDKRKTVLGAITQKIEDLRGLFLVYVFVAAGLVWWGTSSIALGFAALFALLAMMQIAEHTVYLIIREVISGRQAGRPRTP